MLRIPIVALVATLAFQDSRPSSQPAGKLHQRGGDAVAAALAECDRQIAIGDLDAAKSAIERAAAAWSETRDGRKTASTFEIDPVGSSDACLKLSLAFEERNDWKRAIAVRSMWEDCWGWCGNCLAGQMMDRGLQLSRLRLQSGETDEALLDLWCIVNPKDAKNHERPSIFIATGEWETCEAYLMAGLFTNRSDEVLAAIRPLRNDDDSRAFLAKLTALRDAYTKKNATAFLDAAADAYLGDWLPVGWGGTARNARARWMGHLLDQMGEPAKEALESRIRTGNDRAISFAMWTHFFELIPSLQALAALESFALSPDGRGRGEFLAFALEVLRFRQRFCK
jgi:hypothetical protein